MVIRLLREVGLLMPIKKYTTYDCGLSMYITFVLTDEQPADNRNVPFARWTSL